jgi:hypothetical protein
MKPEAQLKVEGTGFYILFADGGRGPMDYSKDGVRSTIRAAKETRFISAATAKILLDQLDKLNLPEKPPVANECDCGECGACPRGSACDRNH